MSQTRSYLGSFCSHPQSDNRDILLVNTTRQWMYLCTLSVKQHVYTRSSKEDECIFRAFFLFFSIFLFLRKKFELQLHEKEKNYVGTKILTSLEPLLHSMMKKRHSVYWESIWSSSDVLLIGLSIGVVCKFLHGC